MEKGDKSKNPCKFIHHEIYDWKDCFNNPDSKNFKGKQETERKRRKAKRTEGLEKK